MSLLGKVYLLVSLILLALGLVWTIVTLGANTGWVEVALYLPATDLSLAFVRRRFEVHTAALLAGWVATVALLAISAIRAPFKIRSAAIARRRTRELEREVLELRTLPLRQEDEDELLAREAHLSDTRRPVILGASAQSMATPRSWSGPQPRREGNDG